MTDEIYLVDTSAWVQLMRKDGDVAICERLRSLIASDLAAWCEIVRVELYHGARSESDFKSLREMEATLQRLEMSPAVWDKCAEVAVRCRQKGKPLPTTDMMVYACAAVHGVTVFHRDQHFETLVELDRA